MHPLLIVAVVLLALALCLVVLFVLVLSKLLDVNPAYLFVASFIRYKIIFDDGIVVKAGLFFIWKTLYPKKKKPETKSPETDSSKKKKPEKPEKKKESAIKQLAGVSGGIDGKENYKEMFSFFLELVQKVVIPTAKKLKNKIKLKIKRLKVEIGSEDAAKTALIYGAASAGGTALIELLSSCVKLSFGKERDVGVVCRYDRTETTCAGELVVKLTPYDVIRIFLPALLKFLYIRAASAQNAGARIPEKSKQKNETNKNK